MERKLKSVGVILGDEFISGIVEEEEFSNDILQVLETLQGEITESTTMMLKIHSRSLHEEILKVANDIRLVGSYGLETEAMVNTKYKTVAKKVKLVASELPLDSEDHIRKAEEEPRLRETRKIGHNFTEETLAKLKIGGGGFLKEPEKKMFQEMISKHGKAFASSSDEIGCVNSKIVAPMVIFIVSHVPWDLKSVPQALVPKLVNLLKEKMQMGILEPFMAP